MSDWFCEYCQETSNPMDHGCNIVTLKSRLSHLSAVNEKLVEILKRIKHVPDIPDFDSSPLEQVDVMCDIADEGLKLADEMGDAQRASGEKG